jgi:hypothetical protein
METKAPTVAADSSEENLACLSRRKAERNRAILYDYRNGATYAAIARSYGIYGRRVKAIVEKEIQLVKREEELFLAAQRPDQPNALHLSPIARNAIADAVGRLDFMPEDLMKIETLAELYRYANFRRREMKELVAWLRIAGHTPKWAK